MWCLLRSHRASTPKTIVSGGVRRGSEVIVASVAGWRDDPVLVDDAAAAGIVMAMIREAPWNRSRTLSVRE